MGEYMKKSTGRKSKTGMRKNRQEGQGLMDPLAVLALALAAAAVEENLERQSPEAKAAV